MTTYPRITPIYMVSPHTDTISIDFGGGAVVVESGATAGWTNGAIHWSLDDYLAAFTAAVVAVTGEVTFWAQVYDLGTTRHIISISCDNAFDLTWDDVALRELLGFTGDLAGDDAYLGDNQARFCFLPDLPVAHGHDSEWQRQSEVVLASYADTRTRLQAGERDAWEITLQWTSLVSESAEACIAWIAHGYPVCYWPDYTDSGNYYHLVCEGEWQEKTLDDLQLKQYWEQELVGYRITPASYPSLAGSTDWTRYLYSPIVSVGYYATIEGLPYVFTEEDTSLIEAAPTDFTCIRCLDASTIKPVSQAIELEDGRCSVRRLDMSMVDDGHGQLAGLFCVEDTAGWSCRVLEGWGYNGVVPNTLTIEATAANPALPFWGYYGLETWSISATAGGPPPTTMTVNERQCFNSPPAECMPPDGGLRPAGRFTTWPRIWDGRVVHIYAYLKDFLGRPLGASIWHEDIEGSLDVAPYTTEIWRGPCLRHILPP